MKFTSELHPHEEAIAPFRRDWIDGVPEVLKSGKEATVFRCTARPETGLEFIAAKFYRPRISRRFRNDAVYREGRQAGDDRLARAIRKKTRTGWEAAFASWTAAEFETLRLLNAAGIPSPRPLTCSDNLLLMEFVGDDRAPAPSLQDLRLAREDAKCLHHEALDVIDRMLCCHRIHGDLSAYNLLVWRQRLTVIDFPQAIDPRTNRNARELLTRDIENVCRYFADYGLAVEGAAFAERIWREYSRARRYSYT